MPVLVAILLRAAYGLALLVPSAFYTASCVVTAAPGLPFGARFAARAGSLTR